MATKGLTGAFFVSVANKGVSEGQIGPLGGVAENKSFVFSEALRRKLVKTRMCGKERT